MKKEYIEPSVVVSVFAVEDVIATSGPNWNTGERE